MNEKNATYRVEIIDSGTLPGGTYGWNIYRNRWVTRLAIRACHGLLIQSRRRAFRTRRQNSQQTVVRIVGAGRQSEASNQRLRCEQ